MEHDELSLRQAGDAYMRYLQGVDVLQRPERWAAAHMIEIPDADVLPDDVAEGVIVYAERLLLAGVKKYIQTTVTPTGVQTSKFRHSSEAVLAMSQMLDTVYDSELFQTRITHLNPTHHNLRPAPFLEHSLFHDVMCGAYGRLRTNDFLDGAYQPSTTLAPFLVDRLVMSPRKAAKLHSVTRRAAAAS